MERGSGCERHLVSRNVDSCYSGIIGFHDRLRKSPGLSDAAVRVALSLSGYADKDGLCWPTQSTVARDLHYSLRKAKNVFRDLQMAGVIEYKVRARHSGERSLIQLRTGAESDTGAESGQEPVQNRVGTGAESGQEPVQDPAPRTPPGTPPYKDVVGGVGAEGGDLTLLEPLLSRLWQTPGFPKDAAKDSELIALLRHNFPALDLGAEIVAWQAYLLDCPLTKNSKPRSQLYDRFRRAQEFRIKDSRGPKRNDNFGLDSYPVPQLPEEMRS
jgi:Helix-turn-helix domain